MAIEVKGQTFHLYGRDFSYVFDVHCARLRHLYYGKKITARDAAALTRDFRAGCFCQVNDAENSDGCLDTMMQELPSRGLGDYRVPALRTRHADGSALCDLKYVSFEILKDKPALDILPSARGGETLCVLLEDAETSLQVKTFYTVLDEENALLRHTEVINNAKTPVYIDRAMTFCLDLPACAPDLTSFYGLHAWERQTDRNELSFGIHTVASCRGASGHQMNPFIILSEHKTDEFSGQAIGIALEYSGDFKFDIEKNSFSQVRVTGGINDDDFTWKLEQNDTFTTPEAILVYSDTGFQKMSAQLHDVIRAHVMNHFAYAPRPVVINSWEAAYFTFDQNRLFEIIDASKGTGVDTFVLDDGWFGARNDDKSALGDWTVNEQKLQGGLDALIERCKQNGLKFGLWLEPEMISEDSELYRAHPDWAIACPGRENVRGRNQLILDMSRKDVRDYILSVFDAILPCHDISYIKWDMNRNMTENMSRLLPPDRMGELKHRYMLGVYDVLKRVTEKYKNVFFEGCAGGGGRFDAGMLQYFAQIWTSDNTDADSRVRIQYGTSLCYPLSAMTAHVSIVPNHRTKRITPMKTRAEIAFFSVFGYELDLTRITDDERALMPVQTALWRKMEPLILNGDFYRLMNPFTGNHAAFMLLDKEKTHGCAVYYTRLNDDIEPLQTLHFYGLDENKQYLLAYEGQTLAASGASLARMGLQMPRKVYDFETIFFTITEEK